MGWDGRPVTSNGSPESRPGNGVLSLSAIVDQLSTVIAGQREPISVALAAIIGGGHVLLEDRPGVGKTVLARAVAQVLGLGFSRIQGTPDLLPTDITGVHIYNPGSTSWDFRAGPIFAHLVLVDELNRATPKAQSALLEAMAEGQTTVDGHTMALPRPFAVIATQNPYREPGPTRWPPLNWIGSPCRSTWASRAARSRSRSWPGPSDTGTSPAWFRH